MAMIDKIIINNFKSHKNTELDLSYLNIFTGVNGVGKSSILQSLLLLKQSFEKRYLESGLELNKPYCEIGFASDALYQYAEEEFISISLFSDEKSFIWNFHPMKLNKTFIPIHGMPPLNYNTLNIFSNDFQYLSAARLSPQESYPTDTLLVETKKQLSIEKGQGELTPHFLYYWGKEQKLQVEFENMLHDENIDKDLFSQVIAWEREISPNVNIVVSPSDKSYSLKYSYNKPGDITSTEEFNAENVGFGLSYALPIIVALLSAKKGGVILLENPEAHLHPKGQSKLAELIALAAQNGIQIFLETHSDHIINGILIASKKFEEIRKGIDKKYISIYHFERDDKTHSSLGIRINVLEGGKIDHQPEGFFDQIDNDLKFILGF